MARLKQLHELFGSHLGLPQNVAKRPSGNLTLADEDDDRKPAAIRQVANEGLMVANCVTRWDEPGSPKRADNLPAGTERHHSLWNTDGQCKSALLKVAGRGLTLIGDRDTLLCQNTLEVAVL